MATEARSHPSGAVGPPGRLGRPAIAALGVLALTLGALQSVVEPALPLLQRELGIGPAEGALVANALLVTGAVATPVAGRLGDRYGGKRVLVRLMAVVVAGGLLASVAPGLPVLLLGQVLQGVMVGALPLSFILVRGHFPAGRSQGAIGLVVALFTGGGMVGTLVAGPIADILSWHAMFALPTLVIAVTTPVVSRLMPDDPPPGPDSRVDWPGMLLLSGTLLAFMLGLVTVTSGGLPPFAVGALALTAAGLATCWVAVERRTASPMVDPRMLARPATAHAYMFTFLVTISSGMVLFLVPQLLAAPQDGSGFGLDATGIGLVLLPGAVAGAVSDSVGGVAARRFGPRAVVVAGTAVTAATMISLASWHTAAWQLALAKAVTAFAAGVGTTALLAGTATAVDARDTGVVTGLLVVTRVIGIALGAQAGGAILAAGADPETGLAPESAFAAGFVTAGLVAAPALLVVRVTHAKKTTDKGVQA